MDEIRQRNGSAPGGAIVAEDGEHPELERLLAYRDGGLGEEEADAVQEHLSLCADCASLLLEFDQFRTDAIAGERGPSEERRREAWGALEAELREERATTGGSAAPASPLRQPPGRQPLSWTVLALAAALGLTILGLVFVLRQGQLQRQADQEAIAAAQKEAAELRAQLEAAQKSAQTGTPTPKPSPPPVDAPPILANQPPGAGSPVPRAVATIAATFGPWLTVRGTSATNPTRLEAGGAPNPVTPDEDGRIVIGFDLGSALDKTNVRLEILDAQGNTLWSGEKLSAVLQGDRGTAAALKGLKPGRYRLRAQAVDGEAAPEYLFEVGGARRRGEGPARRPAPPRAERGWPILQLSASTQSGAPSPGQAGRTGPA